MKQYLWAVLAVLFVSAHASENPFDLEENLGKIEQEQTEMLAELQKLVEAKELAEEELDDDSDLDADEDEDEEEISEVDQTPVEETAVAQKTEEVPAVKVAEATKETATVAEVKKDLSEIDIERAALLSAIKKTEDALKDAKEEQKVVADKLAVQEAEKAEAAKVELARQEQAKKDAIRKAAQAKEEEQREVAAYEKQRAEKIAKAKEDAKLEASKTALESTGVEKVAVVREAKKSAEGTAVSDINVSREYLEETKAADVIYADAVKEMSKSDYQD